MLKIQGFIEEVKPNERLTDLVRIKVRSETARDEYGALKVYYVDAPRTVQIAVGERAELPVAIKANAKDSKAYVNLILLQDHFKPAQGLKKVV